MSGLRDRIEAAIIEHRDSIWPAQLRATGDGGGWTYEAHLARYLSEFALDGRAAVRERDALREAAQRVVDQAETDDDFDGQYIDLLVPAEAIDALRALLDHEAGT